MIKDAKEIHFAYVIENNKGDQRSLFQCIDHLFNRRTETRFPSCSSDQILAENFNNFFVEKIVTIRQSVIADDTTSIPNTELSDAPYELTFFQSVSSDRMLELIVSSKVKSCDLDPVPAVVLKNCLSVLIPVITEVVNCSLATASVPHSLKTAQIRPLLKKDNLDFEKYKNFRPVSNLPFISKIIEKSVAYQLVDYIDTNGLGETFQSAYKRLHSTETALLRVHDDILRAIDQNKSVALLLLDMSAAFDLVDHDILLHRLEYSFGIKGTVLSWFQSYLSNRRQYVSVRGKSSTCHDLRQGVPQGSVLGPILYLLYTSPLGNIVKKHDMLYHFYADDTQIYMSFDSNSPDDITITKLEACISDVCNWMSSNRLKLNSDKTEFLVFGSKFRPRPVLPPIGVGNDLISPSEFARNIGVIFDKYINYESQVSAICKSSFFHVRNISRIRKYLDSIKTLVHAFITCKLDNCNSLLYGLPQNLLNRLQRVLNCAARLIFNKRKFDHVTPLLQDLHWLPIKQRIVFKILVITYKALNGLAPAYITDLLDRYIPTRSLRSASQNLLMVPRSNTVTYGDRAFSVCAPKLWNALPIDIRSLDTLNSFKSRLKTHLFRMTYF